MLRGKASLFLAVLATSVIVVGGVLTWSVPRAMPARADELTVDPAVRARIHRHGNVRVLVDLRLPSGAHVPEGALPDLAATAGQRVDIATIRSQVLSRLKGTRHRVIRAYQTVPLVALDIGGDALAQLEASGQLVRRVMEDKLRAPTLPQSVPLVEGDQAWTGGYDGTGTMVAILDTGVDSSHPFLADKVVEEACFSSTFTGQSSSVCPGGQDEEIGPGVGAPCPLSIQGCWHGTHVAGIAAGDGEQAGQTFSGVARGAGIMAVQVFSRIDDSVACGGSAPCVLAWDSDIIAGLERVYALRAQHTFGAVNLSLGGGLFSSICDGEPEKPAIDNLRSVGIATVIAAGNNGSVNGVSAPGCISTAVSVGATTKSDAIASFSNAAPFVSLLAPGSSIWSSYPGGLWAYASGTSMATPHVTGAFALLRQAAPTATVDDMLAALQQTGVPIPDTRPGGTVTAQRIRIVHAIQALGSVSVNPVPAISALQPVSAAAGSGGFTLTVRGDNFVSGSVVRWNGGNRTTTYVDAGQLTAAIPAGDVATRGTASVTVSSPQPGGGVSNSASFTITGRLPTFALTVTKVGKGTVTSSPAGINCGSACAKAYATGTSVTLTATASARSVFRTWGGACSGSQPSCRVSMTTARTVKATFR